MPLGIFTRLSFIQDQCLSTMDGKPCSELVCTVHLLRDSYIGTCTEGKDASI